MKIEATDPDLAKRIAEWERDPSRMQADAMLFHARRTGLLINKTIKPDDPGLPGCWLGGRPTLPPEIEWPWYEIEGKKWAPMHFMAQLNLEFVPQLIGEANLPRKGHLLFFYDSIFAPVNQRGQKACKFIFIDGGVEGAPYREIPEIPELPSWPLGCDELEPFYQYLESPVPEYERWNFNIAVVDLFVPGLNFSREFTESQKHLGDQYRKSRNGMIELIKKSKFRRCFYATDSHAFWRTV